MFFNSMDMNQWKNILLITLTVWVAGVSCDVKDPDIPQANLSVSETSVVTDFEYAVLNGRASCNFTIQDLFLEYSTDPNLSSATKVHSENSGGDFHIVLNGLGIQTTYYYRYSVSNKFGSLVDNQIRQFKTHDYTEPEVQSLAASSIQGTKAVLEGRVNYSCGKAILNKGFLFGRKGEEMKPLPVTGEDFKLALTNLEMGTEYTFQAFAESEIGTGYGNTLSFTTCPPVSFLTTEVSQITATSALVKGGVLSDGGVPILERGFCYQAGSDAVISIPYYTSTTLTNLTPDTIYTVWYYAITDDGEFKSDPVTFTTRTPITFYPVEVESVRLVSAKVKGGVQNNSTQGIVREGFMYAPVSSPEQVVTLLSQGEITISGLTLGTNYYVWYFAETPIGVFESDKIQFSTLRDLPELLWGTFSVSKTKTISFSRGLVYSLNNQTYLRPDQVSFLGSLKYDANEYITGKYSSEREWTLLSNEEWKYLFEERANAANLAFFDVKVDDIAGVILLPDGGVSNPSIYKNEAELSLSEFRSSQDEGVVFIPYSGYQIHTYVYKSDHEYSEVAGVGSVAFMDTTTDKAVSIGKTSVNYYAETYWDNGSELSTITKDYYGTSRLVSIINK